VLSNVVSITGMLQFLVKVHRITMEGSLTKTLYPKAIFLVMEIAPHKVSCSLSSFLLSTLPCPLHRRARLYEALSLPSPLFQTLLLDF